VPLREIQNKEGGSMKKGDLVNIYTTTFGGKQILEGHAKLVKPSNISNEGLSNGYEYWLVEFTDQKGEYFDRVVRVTN
jgi:hypothetical protein